MALLTEEEEASRRLGREMAIGFELENGPITDWFLLERGGAGRWVVRRPIEPREEIFDYLEFRLRIHHGYRVYWKTCRGCFEIIREDAHAELPTAFMKPR